MILLESAHHTDSKTYVYRVCSDLTELGLREGVQFFDVNCGDWALWVLKYLNELGVTATAANIVGDWGQLQ